MSGKRRKSYEAGHRPKFLAVVDESAECGRAIRFAARRASRTGAGVVLLSIVAPAEFHQWLGVGEVMLATDRGSEAFLAYAGDATATLRVGSRVLVLEYFPPRTVVVEAM